jgi:hypothetical protein
MSGVSADTLIGGLIAAALVLVVLYGAVVAFCAQVNATDADTKRPEAVADAPEAPAP